MSGQEIYQKLINLGESYGNLYIGESQIPYFTKKTEYMLQANLNRTVKFIAIKCFDIPNLNDYK